jgi:DNA polymerase-3 subunit alpha
MSSRSYLEGFYVKPRLDHDLISEHSEGIIVLSGCLNSEICQALLRNDYNFALNSAYKMQSIVGKENYFIEIQNHGLAEQRRISNQLIDIAKTINAEIVPTGDCHYVHKRDVRAHDIMLCVATNSTVHTPDRFSFSGDNFYLKSYKEMESIFNSDWLENTMQICDMVDIDLKFGEIYFPNFPIPTKESSTEYFQRLAWEGLENRYGSPLSINIIERANYEIKVVKEMGFAEYFLVVSDLVRWAKSNDIRVGWGRGSAAGSVLSYAFDITNLDPIKFGLLFERFLVEGRKSMPDIDLDFDDRHRDRVIDYARSKYGSDRVAHICTFNRTGARQSVRDAARALGYDYSAGDRVAKLIPPPVLGISKSLNECMEVQEFSSIYTKDWQAKEIIDAAFGLENLVRQTGIHAAGIVISRNALTEYLPIMQKGIDKPIVTQWDMARVEQCGLLKIDFLGLRNLSVIDTCIKLVKVRRNLDIDVNNIPIDDGATYDLLCRGQAIGVFQLESSSVRQLMIQLQPKNIEDIMALISLHRPGPMGSGMDRLYIDRKHGRSEIIYVHPKLRKVLGSSLGIMLYQEDVLGVARELAGFSSAEADDLRKVIGKKLMDKIALFREKFVKGCETYSGLENGLANKIYSDIEYFGGYGFNRAHAASYAMVSYITAYLKTHYTAEYMAALMSSVVGNKEKLAVYLADCKKHNIAVLPPSINKSEKDFKVIDDNTIIFGLSAINGVGESIADALINSRNVTKPYINIYDFFRRTDTAILKKSTLEHFAKAGALDELVHLSKEFDITRKYELEILEKEKEELGIYVSKHPIEGMWDFLERDVTAEIQDVYEMSGGANVKIGGIITNVKKIITKKGQKMFKFILEDFTGEIEVIAFPRESRNLSDSFFSEGDIVIITGSINRENEEEMSVVRIFFNSIDKIDATKAIGTQSINLSFNKAPSMELVQKIYDIIEPINGPINVFFSYIENNKKVTFRFKKTTSLRIQDKINELVKAWN